MPKDTKTRYQGVYARHKKGCAVEGDGPCNCKPSFWGKAWDRAAGRHRKTRFLQTIAAARSAKSDLEKTLRAGQLPVTRTMRLDAGIDRFIQAAQSGTALNKHRRRYKKKAVKTLEGALNGHVILVLGQKQLGHVRRRHVQGLVDALAAADMSGSSVRRVVNSIRSFYAWAQDRELVDHDPAQRVRLPAVDEKPRDRVVTPDEFAQLLAVLPIVDALVYALAGYATARRAEIRHLLKGDFDEERGVLYLGADDEGRKSRAAQRPFPVVRPLRVVILRARLAGGQDASPLLCPGRKPGGRNSGMLSFEALQKRCDKTWKTAGLKRITPHELRHTAITWLDDAGVRHKVISLLAGHELPHGGAQVTGRYTHELPGDFERARVLFDAYLARGLAASAG